MLTYYIVSTFLTVALISGKIVLRKQGPIIASRLVSSLAFFVSIYQFVIFANGDTLLFPETTAWIRGHDTLRFSALFFAVLAAVAVVQFQPRQPPR